MYTFRVEKLRFLLTSIFVICAMLSGCSGSDDGIYSKISAGPAEVVLPDGYNNKDLLIKEAAGTVPEKIHNHYVPVGRAYDVKLAGKDDVKFGDQYARLHYSYNPDELEAAGLIPAFKVFYYDEHENAWRTVDRVETDIENSKIIAFTSHFTIFVLTASFPREGGIPPAPACITNDFPPTGQCPGGICGTGHAKFSTGDENYTFYQDRNFTIRPVSQSSANAATFAELGFDRALVISTYNGYSSGWGDPDETGLDHRKYEGKSYIQFTARIDLDLYLMYDSRGGVSQWDINEDAPWINNKGFVRNINGKRYFVETTGGAMVYTVYKRPYNRGQLVQLHGNLRNVTDSKIRANYWLVVKPRGSLEGDTAFDMCVNNPSGAPSRVSSLQAISGSNDAGNPLVTLTWENPDDPDFRDVIITRSTDTYLMNPGSPSIWLIPDQILSPQSYRDDAVAFGQTYFYTAFVRDSDGTIDISEFVAVTTGIDSDLDGLSDDYEINVSGTLPNFSDSDEDGISDGDEVARGTDPWNEDVTAPVITDITITSTLPTDNRTLSFQIDGTDDEAITGVMVTMTDAEPLSNNSNWQDLSGNEYLLHENLEFGTYTLYGWAKDAAGNVSVLTAFSTVEVAYADVTPPVLTLAGENPASVEVGYAYSDAGATAFDSVDGNLTAAISAVNMVDTSTVGQYTVTYDVVDAAGNAAIQVTRTVSVTPDVTPPVITLLGDNPVIIDVGSDYIDAGATASDNIDGDVSGNITIDDSAVNISMTGSYPVVLNAADLSGNAAVSVTRVVNVNVIETKLQASDIQRDDRFSRVSISGKYAIVGAFWEDGGDGDPVTTAGAAYIFEQDADGNWNEVQILHASDMKADDWFGYSVSINGNYAIVGAMYEDGGSGDPYTRAGAAYIFERDEDGDWNEVALLHASDIQAEDRFGRSVAISGNYAVVGSPLEDGGSGDPLGGAGAAYIFERDADGSWNQKKILHASDKQAYDNFGISVSINGRYAIIGANSEDGGDGNSELGAGAAYIFKRKSNGKWKEVDILHASDKQQGDNFAVSVSINGSYAIVGANYEDGGAGDPYGVAGAAYIFERDADGKWNETVNLHASDMQSGDYFGYSVSINNNCAIVGAFGENGGTGDPSNSTGAAYIFKRDADGTWNEADIYHASDTQPGDYFGVSVSISGNNVIVGAPLEDGGPGNPYTYAGAAYIYNLDYLDKEIPVITEFSLRRTYPVIKPIVPVKVAAYDDLHLAGWLITESDTPPDPEGPGWLATKPWNYTLSSGFGSYTLYAWVKDSVGNVSGPVSVTVEYIDIEQKTLASDIQSDDRFGCSAAVSGNYAIVGARAEDGGEGDSVIDAGAAYIYERDADGNWNAVQPLHASDMQAGDNYGISVSISGNYAIVGAYYEDGGTDSPFNSAGAAYIFERAADGSWNEVEILHASDMQPGDRFGWSVSISGTYALVGAYNEDGGQGNPENNAGAAYIYEQDLEGNWNEVKVLRPSGIESGDSFGFSVSISGRDAIVGARYEDGGSDNPVINAGAAYIFRRKTNGTWKQAKVLRASDMGYGDGFGTSVAIKAGYAVVGAPFEDGGDGNPVGNAGAAYIFERDADWKWNEVAIVDASDKEISNWFGQRVSIHNDYAVIGASGKEGTSSDDPFYRAGAAYLFERNTEGAWKQVEILHASDRQPVDRFSYSASISGNSVILGAPLEDGGPGDPYPDAGAAYFYDIAYLDNEAPVISEFTLTGTNPVYSPEVPFKLEQSDNMGVTSWLVKETPDIPGASDPAWLDEKPTTYTVSSGFATYILYAWVMDAAGLVSNTASMTFDYVPDDIPPLITLLGNDPEYVEHGYTYTDAGATALDNLDGDITDLIYTTNPVDTGVVGTRTVTYDVNDAAGNSAVPVTRTVVVTPDVTPPVITLVGDPVVDVEVGYIYSDAGAAALDNIDGDITASIITNSNVNTSVVGAYRVRYDVIDAAGNKAKRGRRTVNVTPDVTPPVITLNGPAAVTVEAGYAYSDAGATAVDLGDGDISSAISTVNPVNIHVVGTYTVTYDVSDASGNSAAQVTRTVTVIPDATPPVITLNGSEIVNVEVGYVYTEAGAAAVDINDGDLTSAITMVSTVDTNTVGLYTVTYDVSDVAGNAAAQMIRTVNVTPDVTPPVITLPGDNPVNIDVGSVYAESGAAAWDNIDGDISGSINIDGSMVNTAEPGTYQVTYTAADLSGNAASEVVRIVNVNIIEKKLLASDMQSGDYFGRSVSISGNYAIVGAFLEKGGDGNPSASAGAAYIYESDTDGNWNEVEVLHASDMQDSDQFGMSVAISGTYAIVGAFREDGGAGDPLSNAGAAYIYERDADGNWNQVKILRASDREAGDSFGRSVSIHGRYAIVGSYMEDGGEANTSVSAGAAYVFNRRTNGTWSEVAILHASDMQSGDEFGWSVSLSDSYAFVGAREEDGGNGDPEDGAGATYIFERDAGSNWNEIQVLHASEMQANDGFGWSVSVSDTYAIVGSVLEDGGDGDPMSNSGAAYIFERDADGTWNEVTALHDLDMQVTGWFGHSVSIHGNHAVVGASGKGDLATGDPFYRAGGTYIFERNSDGNWNEAGFVQASDMQALDRFGLAVSLSGNNFIVSSYGEDGGPGDLTSNAGAAYIYNIDYLDKEVPIITDFHLTRNHPLVDPDIEFTLEAYDDLLINGWKITESDTPPNPNDPGWLEEKPVNYTLMSGYGTYTLYAWVKDVAGNVSDYASVTAEYKNIEQKIMNPDMASGDFFGNSVSISGNYALVGAQNENDNAGGAHIYELDSNGTWNETALLQASDMELADRFGTSVSISGNYALAGAPYEDGGAGSPLNNAGAAYIFERDADGTWNETGLLRASDMQEGDYFGWSVAVDGAYALVGAYGEDGGSGSPVNFAGAVYIFERDGDGNWNEIQVLHASDMKDSDVFGATVSIHGSCILVGAPNEDGGAGDPVTNAGAVYIFEKNTDGIWQETGLLYASDMQTGDYFGHSVSISGTRAIVGAYSEDGGAGDPVSIAGAAYIFERDTDGNWNETAILHASDMQVADTFGNSVSINGDYAHVGAYGEDGGEGDLAGNAGASYIYQRDTDGAWNEVALFHASDMQANDYFGNSVSISNNTILVGAFREDGGPGDPVPDAGAAYLYDIAYLDDEAPVIDEFAMTSPEPIYNSEITINIESSDNMGVTNWIIKETPDIPDVFNPAWQREKPTGYTLTSGYGTYTLYAWVMDGAGFVSNGASVTFDSEQDLEAPLVTVFDLTSTLPLTVPEVSFELEGTDNNDVSSWIITEVEIQPDLNDAGWLPDVPQSYTLTSGYGSYTLYAWARDANNNISYAAPLAVEYRDGEAPVIEYFILTSGSPTVNPGITFELSGSDNVAVTGWMVTSSEIPPDAGDSGWLGAIPAGYTLASYGTYTFYAWARDFEGNVSISASLSVEYDDTEPPVITEFSLEGGSPVTDPNISIDLHGTDNVAITGWMITESAVPPAAGDSGWNAGAPESYTLVSGYGTVSVYAWAKDYNGNVSSSASVTLEYRDAVAPPDVMGFILTAGAVSVELSWAIVSVPDLAGIRIVRKTTNDISGPEDGTLVCDGCVSPYTDTGLSGNQPYYYMVFAYDTSNNYSAGVSGSVTIDGGLVETDKVIASDGQYQDQFGYAVSVSGKYAIVGARFESGGDGDPAQYTGAAYIYEADADSNWNEAAVLHASDMQAGDSFGSSVSMSGTVAVVGAYSEDGGAGDLVSNAGAAYVFERSADGTWSEVAILRASDQQAMDGFGISVSISGTYIIIGAAIEAGGDGDPFNRAGAAYIFERDADGSWNEASILHASDIQPDDLFGLSVSISGTYAVVGAREEDGGDGDPVSGAGAAYIFERDADGNWIQAGEPLHASEMGVNDRFSGSVSISGNNVIIGASAEDGGVGGPVSNAGAAYIFERDAGGIWSSVAILHASDMQMNDIFGSTVSINGNFAVVGATREDGGDGDPLAAAGAAYLFECDSDGNWNQSGDTLRASDQQAGDLFGHSVSMSGNTVLIGALFGDGGIGSPVVDAGAAYVYNIDYLDNEAPVITDFSLADSNPVSDSDITINFEASDDIVIDGWIIRESETPPDAGDAGWLDEKPHGYTLASGYGTYTLYAWVKDSVGNVSEYASLTVVFKSIEQKIMVQDQQQGDEFGNAVSISGQYVLVGAQMEDGGAADSFTDAGSAFIFETDANGTWTEVTSLHASDRQASDRFGNAVSLSGDYAIVGAYVEDGGDGFYLSAAGAAYIFEKDGDGNWSEAAILHASDMQAGDRFGYSVSINGSYAIVGAYVEKGGAGDPVNSAGAAYIFERDADGHWNEVAILHASDMQAGDYFGQSVSMSGTCAIVGARGEDGGAGDPENAAGAVYIFERDTSGNWNETSILHASDMQAGDVFGQSVSISGTYAIVGAYTEDGGAGSPVSDAGAAYIFERDGDGNWNEAGILHASDMQTVDFFGWSVSISGTYAVVGASNEDGGEGGFSSSAGAAYIFERDTSGGWNETSILHASDLQAMDLFGCSVSISDSAVIVGANYEDGGEDDPVVDAGTAYIYNIDTP